MSRPRTRQCRRRPGQVRGKAEVGGTVRADKCHQTCRGIGDGMQAMGTIRNMGSPSGDRSMDQLAARERQAGLAGMAERPVTITKPGNSWCWNEPNLIRNANDNSGAKI